MTLKLKALSWPASSPSTIPMSMSRGPGAVTDDCTPGVLASMSSWAAQQYEKPAAGASLGCAQKSADAEATAVETRSKDTHDPLIDRIASAKPVVDLC